MAAQSGSKKDTTTVKTSTTSDAATGRPDAGTASPPQSTTQSAARSARPAPSARSGIRLNVGVVLTAIDAGSSSRAIKAIQYALADRGFDPGRRDGVFDRPTLDAYARYQDSIGETGRGEPTGYSLDYLGFDVI